jgi:hypothetical protein
MMSPSRSHSFITVSNVPVPRASVWPVLLVLGVAALGGLGALALAIAFAGL